MKPTLGDFIRKRRLELGLTQRQVALALNFKSIAYLSDIEGGNRNPGPEVLPKLAEVLQVSAASLEDLDLRLPVQAARELLEMRPEMVAAFRRAVKTAWHLTPEELERRLNTPSTGGGDDLLSPPSGSTPPAASPQSPLGAA